MSPYFQNNSVQLFHGDCREVLPSLDPVDCVCADPPYGETSCKWDVTMWEWLHMVSLKATGSMWCFGSLRMFMAHAGQFDMRWRMSHDVVWEKHNGSNMMNDRFSRVHEYAAHFYERGKKWGDIYKNPQYTMDAVKRSVKRSGKPQHWGKVGAVAYESKAGGRRLARSVMRVRSCHGYAVHPTQKPLGIVDPLLRYACPVGGVVLDPMCGSGSMLMSAMGLGMHAIGIEIDEESCEKAARRLEQGVQTEMEAMG